MIRIRKLSAGYGQSPVLEDFSLDLEPGEIYALIGPSGCGKSTLLKVLCGILPPREGSVEYAGRPVSSENGISIGYVPQNYGLLDWKTTRANIFLPWQIGGGRKRIQKKDPNAAQAVIEELGLTELLQRYPSELSGGQKQRAALARAFISAPDLLLMDEPFSALDAFTAEASQALFLKIWQRRRITTLFITHSMVEAAALGTRILLMDPAGRRIGAGMENRAAMGSDAEKLAVAAALKERFREMLS